MRRSQIITAKKFAPKENGFGFHSIRVPNMESRVLNNNYIYFW